MIITTERETEVLEKKSIWEDGLPLTFDNREDKFGYAYRKQIMVSFYGKNDGWKRTFSKVSNTKDIDGTY